MFYIDQLRTPSFPIGLFKTESGFIVGSVETGLGRLMLVVAVISVNAYPFFGSLRPEASPSTSKNTRVVLVPCLCMEVCPPTAISCGVDISEVPGCYFLRQMSSQ